MRNIHHRLLSLNLALIALLSFSAPAYARAPGEEAQPAEETTEAPAWALGEDEYAPSRAEGSDRNGSASEEMADEQGDIPDSPLMLAENDSSYLLSVNGVYFNSNEVRSGTGWSYEDGKLLLNSYNGEAITASGDLYIYTYGTSTVQGRSGMIGANGIAVSGDLAISVRSGSLSVFGGDGAQYGGHAVSVGANAFYCYLYGGTASFHGGNAYNGEEGGHGIYAAGTYVYGPGNSGTRLTASGGAGSMSYENARGGCGIFGTEIDVSAAADIRGGNGNVAAPAIFSYRSCEFGCVNAELYGGRNASNGLALPIQFDKSVEGIWYYHPHTTVAKDYGHYSITVNRYRLALLGNGGWRGNATFTDLVDYYPAYYDLSEYAFSRDGYTQVAWTSASGDLVPLDKLFTPRGNTYLSATWVETRNGDILLNGLSGKLDDGAYWRHDRGVSSVTLPSTLQYDGENIGLAGWHSILALEEDSIGIMNGAWYEPGSSVSASTASSTTLYALKNDVGSYVVYHMTDGEPNAGGNMLLQHRYEASCSDLEVYIADGETYLTAPEGYRFSGWSEQAGGEVMYHAGETVTVSEGSPLHLYAVWQPLEYKYSAPACDVWVEPVSKTLTLEIAPGWYEEQKQPETLISAVYDENGKMLSCSLLPVASGSLPGAVSLRYSGDELPVVKAFAVGSGCAPAGQSIEVKLSEMTPSDTK